LNETIYWALAGADWLPKFWWDFFSRSPKKNADLKKKVIKNYKGQVPLSKQKISTNQADLKKKGHDGHDGPQITLGAPWKKSHLVIWSVRPWA
jgi:hypothetical protein